MLFGLSVTWRAIAKIRRMCVERITVICRVLECWQVAIPNCDERARDAVVAHIERRRDNVRALYSIIRLGLVWSDPSAAVRVKAIPLRTVSALHQEARATGGHL